MYILNYMYTYMYVCQFISTYCYKHSATTSLNNVFRGANLVTR